MKNFQLALGTVLIVAVLVGLRALLFAIGIEGCNRASLPRAIAGGVFVMGLVIAHMVDEEGAPGALDDVIDAR